MAIPLLAIEIRGARLTTYLLFFLLIHSLRMRQSRYYCSAFGAFRRNIYAIRSSNQDLFRIEGYSTISPLSSGRRSFELNSLPKVWLRSNRQLSRLFSVVPRLNEEVESRTKSDRNQKLASNLDGKEEFARFGRTKDSASVDYQFLSDEITLEDAISNQERLYEGLKSKPINNGKWKPEDPLGWTKNFGRRSARKDAEFSRTVNLSPGDEGYYDVSDTLVDGVTIVRTNADAEIVVNALMNSDPLLFHACDTEVMGIDLGNVGPVGNGYVTCASIYSGPDFDYGLGDGPGTVLWIDNLDDAAGVLQIFKPWFEDPKFLKVWHNYGFDRHVMWNEGIDVRGFGGDTMHMARLQDTGRAKYGTGSGFSLEALTDDLLDQRKQPMKEIFGVPRMRKDGTPGSIIDLPSVEDMQRKPEFRAKWIQYSAYDAECTWCIREKLQELLEDMHWTNGETLYFYYFHYLRYFGEVLTDMERRGIRVDAKDYLAKVEAQAREDRAYHVDAFRQWAGKQIGPDGLALNPASSLQLNIFLFGGTKNKKTGEATDIERILKIPREEIPEDAILALKERDAQLVHSGQKEPEEVPDTFDVMTVDQLKTLCKANGLKVGGKKAELKERLRGHFLSQDDNENETGLNNDDFDGMDDDSLRHTCVTRGLPDRGNRKALLKRLREDSAYANELLSANCPRDKDTYKRISEALALATKNDSSGVMAEVMGAVMEKETTDSKYVDIHIKSIGMTPTKFTAGGAPSVTADVLRGLAGDPTLDDPKYGTAYEFFGGGEKGHEACMALYSLTAIGSIDTMISNFLTSLQFLADEDSRVHCSLNFNTETGRLSSRRPNLQNQPALEKDKYQIRKAFQASPGNNLIVADYGQLELRLLASMTKCVSMIDAFRQGGDFHSRTAMGMFDYIQKKVDDGDILFEWDYSRGEPPKPMLKDEYASERRKAKTLNFSIAYGKTAHGLSQDWGVSMADAEDMLQKWYNSRPEVEKWQKNVKALARKKGFTRTLMYRYRSLPEAMGKDRKALGHAERASINTPIQGGAADIAMMAMIKANKSEKLKRLGWVLLLQIHDELILEGPEETAEEAFEEVLKCMESPWVYGLDETLVPLLVDGSHCHKNWYDAK